MKLSALVVSTALAVATVPAMASAEVKLSDLGDPAILVVSSTGATVTKDGENTVLLLDGAHPLVLYSANVHQYRVFDSYPITDFASSYNSCNEMKAAYELWHEDGANTLFTFQTGPDNGEQASHRMYSPLVTSPQAHDTTRVTGATKGTIPIFVETADYDQATGNLSFKVAGHTLALGDYENVLLQLECVGERSQHGKSDAVPLATTGD